MKIALVAPYEYTYPGGVNEHIFHLDRCFRDWGHEVKILAACAEDAQNVPENVIRISRSITSVPFSGSISRVTLSPRIYWPIKRLLRKERFDVIHIHEPLTPTLPLFVLRHAKSVTVATFHAYREKRHWALQTMAPLVQPMLHKLDARICVSEASYNLMNHYFPGDYRIIPNGIDFAEFGGDHVQPVDKYTDGRPNILFVGRLEKRKGFRYLIRAFPYIVDSIPNARLLVVGAYNREDKEPFVRYARMHGLHSVRFVGRVSRQDLPRYYKTADVFCAPSTGFESFGIVLLEAMAAGKPIVASSIPGYRGVLEHGREGWLVEPENERALADAIIELLQNPALRQEMSQHGRQKAAGYDWPIIARRVLDVYEELIQQKAETA